MQFTIINDSIINIEILNTVNVKCLLTQPRCIHENEIILQE